MYTRSIQVRTSSEYRMSLTELLDSSVYNICVLIWITTRLRSIHGPGKMYTIFKILFCVLRAFIQIPISSEGAKVMFWKHATSTNQVRISSEYHMKIFKIELCSVYGIYVLVFGVYSDQGKCTLFSKFSYVQ